VAESITDILSVWDGVVRGDLLELLAGSDQLTAERAPHAFLVEFTDTPKAVATVEWTARDIAPDPEHPDAVIVLGLNGEVARFRQGKVEPLPSISGPPPSSERGTMLALAHAGGSLMACGGNQQVYRYRGNGTWVRFDDGLTRPEDGGISQFEFVVGDPSHGNLYTGGARGELWRHEGRQWRRIEMPTNLRLIAATPGADGTIWIAGQLGTLLRGSGEEWEVLHQDKDIPYFWDLAFVGGRLFLTTNRVLYEWKDGAIEVVNFADDSLYEGAIPYSFYKLGVAGDRLYTFGAKDVMCLENDRWRRIV
jgi:hypothetical protein